MIPSYVYFVLWFAKCIKWITETRIKYGSDRGIILPEERTRKN